MVICLKYTAPPNHCLGRVAVAHYPCPAWLLLPCAACCACRAGCALPAHLHRAANQLLRPSNHRVVSAAAAAAMLPCCPAATRTALSFDPQQLSLPSIFDGSTSPQTDTDSGEAHVHMQLLCTAHASPSMGFHCCCPRCCTRARAGMQPRLPRATGQPSPSTSARRCGS
jgi:hypothetical protein